MIKGTVTDDTGMPMIGANVVLDDTDYGAVTDIDGAYELSAPAGTYDLLVTYIGFADSKRSITLQPGQSMTLDIEMVSGTYFDEVVVSASKRPEKITESPATIQTIFARQIQEYAGNPAELLARQKGIDYFRAGIAGPAFNIRGFNSNFNSKNLQVTDGRFASLIATGLPLGALDPVIKEDIERVEVILGPNSTLYGPNAHNGLMNTITKDPRTSEGTILAFNPGVSGDGEAYYSARIRHAQVLSDKFAFKAFGEYTSANEFNYADSVFINRDGVGGAEGYEEYDLDESVEFARVGGALYFSPTDDVDIIYNTGYSNSTFLSPTNVGRNQIKDWKINFHQLKLTSKNWFAQVGFTSSKTDSTYAIDERTKQYYRLLDAGLSEAEASGPLSYGSGALFVDDSKRWNAELQYNNTFGALGLIAGVQYQKDMANSKGTYLLDGGVDGDGIDVSQTGVYAHLTYELNGGWRAIAAARADNHEIYDFNFVPKMGLLKVGDLGTWRFTYGQGIAAPTILNMYGNLFSGLILGNAEGFTLIDGSMVEKQTVEKIQTFELGWRGRTADSKLYVDANAYYNISEDFLSPVTVVGVTTHRGDTPISEVQSGFGAFGGLVATYINFGKVNTYGFDIGTTYYINDKWSSSFNYSYFDYSVDEDNMDNDFNNDGVVNFLDILVNSPNHKFNVGLNYSDTKWFGTLFGRWVQSYDYFSSFQIASQSHPGLTYRGVPIVENARSADTFNYGPLGGFFTVDATLGYRVSDQLQISAAATNLFNQALREFTATAPTKGLYTIEFRVSL